ncbi:MAG: Panacea domain-containing protein [Rivularia sp. (in: cyanobacteria)]
MGSRVLHETFDVPRGQQRFRELIIYVSKKSEDDPHFGAIKLNKILYYSDFRAFERFGMPLTGVRYHKLKLGPAPKSLIPVRNALEAERAIRVDRVRVGEHDQHRTVALRAPAMSLFTEDEVQLIDEVIDDLWGQTGSQVSDASHDIRWRLLNLKDPMPYELAYLSDEQLTNRDIRRTDELAIELGW